MNGERKDFLSVTPSVSADVTENGKHPAQSRAAQFISDREGNLPVWVRAPTFGHEFYSGCSRPKLYEWAAKGFIRSVSIREPGRIKGVRLFHLASILTFIERCEAGAFTEETNQRTR
jgi:hypothetical protein